MGGRVHIIIINIYHNNRKIKNNCTEASLLKKKDAWLRDFLIFIYKELTVHSHTLFLRKKQKKKGRNHPSDVVFLLSFFSLCLSPSLFLTFVYRHRYEFFLYSPNPCRWVVALHLLTGKTKIYSLYFNFSAFLSLVF